MRAMVWAVCVLVLAGCAGLGGYREPVRVTLSDIRVIDATLLEQLYEVTLRVQNRTDRPISINGGSFDLAIRGRDFGSGVTDRRLTVPAYSDATLEVRMVSTVFGVFRLLQGLQQVPAEVIDYRLSGHFSVPDSFAGLRFRESGEITLPGRSTDDQPTR